MGFYKEFSEQYTDSSTIPHSVEAILHRARSMSSKSVKLVSIKVFSPQDSV